MAAELSITSRLFEDGAPIPASAAHPSVGGANRAPDLHFAGVPDGTGALAVTCYDPDAPTTVGFVHWVLLNLPAGCRDLPEGAGEPGRVPDGAVVGFTDWGESRYGGMAPPPGDEAHRYQFTVWALDGPLDAAATTTYAKFRFLSNGHVLASATLTGRFGVDGA